MLLLVVAGLARAEAPADSPTVITIGVVADNEPYHFREVYLMRDSARYLPPIQNLTDLEDLSDYRLAIGAGIYYEEAVKEILGTNNLRTFSAQEPMFQALAKGDVDVVINALHSGNYWIHELGISGVRIAGELVLPGFTGEDLRFGIRPSLSPLADILNQALASISPTEQRTIETRWLGATARRADQQGGRIEWNETEADWLQQHNRRIRICVDPDWNRKLGRLNRELADANEALSRLSVTDNLTQLGNRSYFDREFPHSFQWCQRHKTGFAAAMVDADHFKRINDTWGHEAGDQCLQALADVMREHFRRDTDRLSRFGGEEFIIFTSYEDASDIMERLERFRTAVANRQCDTCQGSAIELTVSIGLAYGVPTPAGSPAEYLRLADQALYAAKGNGRNRLEARQTGRKT